MATFINYHEPTNTITFGGCSQEKAMQVIVEYLFPAEHLNNPEFNQDYLQSAHKELLRKLSIAVYEKKENSILLLINGSSYPDDDDWGIIDSENNSNG